MAICLICSGAHAEISHVVSTIGDLMPSKLISQASAAAASAYRKTQVDSLLRTLKRAGNEVAQLVDNPVAFIAMYSPIIALIQKLMTPEEAAVESDVADVLPVYREIEESMDAIFAASGNNALRRYVRIVLVAEKARAVAAAKVQTAQEADALRTELVDEIDEIMLETPDDATYQALAGMKSALVVAVDELKKQAKLTGTYQVADPQHELALAYRIYGDASRAAEIVERNNIKNPALVPGGMALEVLV